MTTIDLNRQLDLGRIPAHIACVMDGNGRWAGQRGLERSAGHAAMEHAMFEVLAAADELGVRWLTLYAFSTENWNRPVDEVEFLMELNQSILVRRFDELVERDVRVRFVGRPDARVPDSLVAEIDRVQRRTAEHRGITMTLAFNYGGRAELVDAVRRMALDGVSSRSLDEDLVQSYLYAPDMPDPDLMVRTSGELRISNFLLWELAYSELVFSDVLWPDFGREELLEAIRVYQARDRRFGGVVPVSGAATR